MHSAACGTEIESWCYAASKRVVVSEVRGIGLRTRYALSGRDKPMQLRRYHTVRSGILLPSTQRQLCSDR